MSAIAVTARARPSRSPTIDSGTVRIATLRLTTLFRVARRVSDRAHSSFRSGKIAATTCRDM